jgi:hypothetical protein
MFNPTILVAVIIQSLIAKANRVTTFKSLEVTEESNAEKMVDLFNSMDK